MNDPIDDPRRLAVAAIVRIDDEGAYANVVLPKMLGDTTMEARDKGFATELVYGSTRMKRRLDHLVDRFLLEPPPPSARAALRIGAHQLLHLDTPPHAAVSATVAAAPKRFRGLVNAVLRKVAAAVTEGVSFPSVGTELSYPDWIVTRLGADLGEERARAALETMNVAAEVHIRDDGYVQDPSSQAVAAAVPVSTGDLVLDACAAPGGSVAPSKTCPSRATTTAPTQGLGEVEWRIRAALATARSMNARSSIIRDRNRGLGPRPRDADRNCRQAASPRGAGRR